MDVIYIGLFRTSNMVVERISCDVQKYAWGKIGSNSTVAKLATNACKDFT